MCGMVVYGTIFLGIVSGGGQIVNSGMIEELHDMLRKGSA